MAPSSGCWIGKLTTAVANTAKIYMQEALQWLIDDQVAASVSVAVTTDGRNTLYSIVTIKRSDGAVVPLKFNWVWRSA